MTRPRWVLLLSNVIPAIFFALIAAYKFVVFGQQGGQVGLSHLLLGIQLMLAVVFFILRQAPSTVSWNFSDVAMAMIGSFAPSFFSLESRGMTGQVSAVGISLQIAGNALSIYGILSLGKSFGILPANRGIQKKGMYQWVRHPLYSSYLIASFGYFFNHPTFYNGAIAMVCLLSQVMRIFAEERLLDQDPAYREYKKQVRWKLVPFVF